MDASKNLNSHLLKKKCIRRLRQQQAFQKSERTENIIDCRPVRLTIYAIASSLIVVVAPAGGSCQTGIKNKETPLLCQGSGEENKRHFIDLRTNTRRQLSYQMHLPWSQLLFQSAS